MVGLLLQKKKFAWVKKGEIAKGNPPPKKRKGKKIEDTARLSGSAYVTDKNQYGGYIIVLYGLAEKQPNG